MKTANFRVSIILSCIVLFFNTVLSAQTGVLDPNDPIVIYNPSSPPVTPPANTLAKWVKTNRLSWNSTSFKCYYYNGIQFRLKFPKSYVPGNGKTYPLYLFFHGVGEKGTIYDNEFQLFHGGQTHRDAVDNDKFDGFLLYPQTSSASGGWNNNQLDVMANLINNYLIPQVQVDPFRVNVNGLSGGGGATWGFMVRHPTLTAGDLPMSGASIQNVGEVANIKYNAFWISNGGLDGSPSPYTVNQVINECINQGANYRHTEYPNLGHGVWNTFWAEPDYFPYMLSTHKANPWPRYGRTEFCVGDVINVTIGVTAGFDGYEWRKNGVLINGANSSTIQTTTTGTFDCRVKKGTQWSVWSPIPVVIKYKTSTISPDIQVTGLASNVLPSLDGKTTVNLQVPTGYTSYVWQKLNPTTTLPNNGNTVTGATIGSYQVKVTEQYGCSSSFSNVFNVVDANGADGPPAPTTLTATALSQTKIRLNWSLVQNPAFVETKFEVYQSLEPNGPFTLIGFAPQRADSFAVNNLSPNVRYYYKIRAINNTAASGGTSVASALTFSDNEAPTPPGNLRTGDVSQSSVTLLWDPSYDASGISAYDIYVNGHVAYTINGDQNEFAVYNLINAQYNTFVVKARDIAGNISSPSNQVVAAAAFSGLHYKYYTFTGTWNNLPDFNTLVPDFTGNDVNVSIANSPNGDNFAYLWEGFITAPSTGNYYFRTTSDDGSRLYLGTAGGTGSPYGYSVVPKVNNDGLHGTATVTSSAVYLVQGETYPIAITFYEQGGGENMSITWRTPTNSNYVSVPNSAFIQNVSAPGNLPNAPSSLTATAVSAKKIVLNWTDNSNDENGFEIYRSTTSDGDYVIAGTVGSDVTTYSDSSLQPSTQYYYKLKSINASGSSALIPSASYQALWNFNNNYNDESGQNHTLSPNNSPTFSTDRQEGSHSVDLNGSNEDMTVNTSSGDYLRGGYNSKTVSFWMNADVTSSGSTRLGVFDFGGSDDGLAMYIQSNNLYAGVAGNNTRRSISTSISTGWNHIALVYSGNTLRLYKNGIQVASNTNLGFSSVGTTSNASMIGDDNSSTAFSTSTSYFGQFNGRFDNFAVIGDALSQSDIASLMNNGTYGTVSATTLALPALPATPTNLNGVANGPDKIDLSWTNNAAVVAKYEVWRSPVTNANYELAATLSGIVQIYNDNSLLYNTTYYYKVRAINEAGNSEYSNEINVTTTTNPVTIVTLNSISTQNIVNDDDVNLNLVATTNLGSTITYSSANLPSFATLVSNPNNTGTINFKPKGNDLGTYNITVTATDNYGGNNSKAFTLNVNGKNQVTINLNFNQALPQAAPWNNTNSAPVANLTVNNLKDNNNNNTTVGFNLMTGMVGSYSNAVTTNNNSGVFPDNVLKTMYFTSVGTPIQYRITGLAQNKKYSFIIHGGYPWTVQQQNTSGTLIGNYSVGTKTASLDAANNTSQTVRFNNLSPDASGNIIVTLQKAPGAGYVIINAMQILSYDDSQAAITFNPPYSVKAVGASNSQIKLTWQNLAETRTGIEIWRSTTPNGTYTLRSAMSSNSVTYTDNGLATGSTFFYKLRSVNNAVYSGFTSPVGASTISYVVKLNMNSQAVLSQSPPWNNLNTLTYSGFSFENMINTQEQATGINFNVLDNFTSFHDGVGINTGNNSGVVPDNVMRTLYYMAGGDSSRFTFTGLNRTQVYNIEFYGGSTFPYEALSRYQIGSEVVELSCLNNTTQTVTIYNVKPDSTGKITVRFFTPSMYSFLNAIMIHGMPSSDIVAQNAQGVPGSQSVMSNILITSTESVENDNSQPIVTQQRGSTSEGQIIEVNNDDQVVYDFKVYPNPFVDQININLNFLENASVFSVVLSDFTGRQLMVKDFRNVSKGNWRHTIQLNRNLPAGIYFLNFIGLPGERTKNIKLIKGKSF